MSQGSARTLTIPVPVAQGGTEATTAAGALVNLGLGTPSGTGNVILQTSPSILTPSITGIISGVSAGTGKVGEILQAQVLTAAPFNLPAWNTPYAMTTLVLTPGFWLALGNTTYSSTVGAGLQAVVSWQQTGTVGIPATEFYATMNGIAATLVGLNVPIAFYNVTANTTVSLCVYAQQGVGGGSVVCTGGIYAVRLLAST